MKRQIFKINTFLFISFLIFFCLVSSTQAIEEEVLDGEIYNCVCTDMISHTIVGGVCTDQKDNCKEACKPFYKSGMKPMSQESRCFSNPCSSGKYGAGTNLTPFSTCRDCKTLTQGHPFSGAIMECTDYFPSGGVSDQKWADPPEVTLEIPFGTTTKVDDLADYISVFYAFIVPLIAIAAVVMVMFGGFKWVTAAGNSGQIGSAKKTITNAVIGLVLALASYLLLYTINPALVSLDTFKIPFVQMSDERPGGSCAETPSGPCSVEELSGTCFKSHADEASGICGIESAGNEKAESGSDRCKNDPAKRPFSIGLFQINLTTHPIGGLNCPEAFEGLNYDCKIVNESLYAQCVEKAKDPSVNIKKACELSNNGDKWHHWGKCGGTWGSNSKCCYKYI